MKKGINKNKIQICILTRSLFFASSPWTWLENYKTWATDTFEIRVRLQLHGNVILDKQIFKSSFSSLFMQRSKKASKSVVPFIFDVFIKFNFTRFVSGDKHFFVHQEFPDLIQYFFKLFKLNKSKRKVNNYEWMSYKNCKIKKHDQNKFYSFLYARQIKI